MYEFYDVNNPVSITKQSSPNNLLMLKSSTLEHTLAKRISYEISTPKEGE